MQQDIHFPVYLKYKNGRSYFKIISAFEFEQIQVIGAKCIFSKTTANQFPEKIFITDLLQNTFNNVEVIKENEFKNLLQTD